MNPIVVKFGGSSLATAAQFEKVAAIIRASPGPAAMLSPPRRASALTAIQRSPIFFTAL